MRASNRTGIRGQKTKRRRQRRRRNKKRKRRTGTVKVI